MYSKFDHTLLSKINYTSTAIKGLTFTRDSNKWIHNAVAECYLIIIKNMLKKKQLMLVIVSLKLIQLQ